MKKLFTLILLLATVFSAKAVEYTELDKTAKDVLYVEATVQTNNTGYLNVYMKTSATVGTVDFQFYLPEGVTIVNPDNLSKLSGKMAPGVEGTYTIYPKQADGSIKNAISGLSWAKSDEAQLVAQIPVNVTAAVGTYAINAVQYQMVRPDDSFVIYNNVSTTLTVQNTAVIAPQNENNAIEIIPFTIAAGAEKTVSILMKSEANVKGLDFDFELPAGIEVPSEEEDGETIYAEPELSNIKGAVSAEITLNDDGSYHYSLSGSTSKYVNKAEKMTAFSTLTLAASKDLADGVYTIKIKNIEDKSGEFTGEYYLSVFVGEPITDAILYGHYTTEGIKAAAALKGGSADITAATIDGELSLNDVLVLAKDKTTYNRAVGSGNYATICVPFALKGAYYTVSEKTETSITLTEATEVPANTPAITKGDIAVSVEGYVPAVTPVAGANGLTGTYEYLPHADGYYLQNNKFHNNWAAVKPFRAYIPAAGGAKSLSIYLETANGIIDITDQLSNEDIYSLQGIKLNKTQKGINIVGGKKIYNK